MGIKLYLVILMTSVFHCRSVNTVFTRLHSLGELKAELISVLTPMVVEHQVTFHSSLKLTIKCNPLLLDTI